MRRIGFLLTTALTLFLFASSSGADPGDTCEGGKLPRGSCIDVAGELRVWNGWPPNIRIEAPGGPYGVGPIERETFPASISPLLPTTINGDFRICPLGEEARVPYLDAPIPLYCIERIGAARYLGRDDAWHELPP